MDRRLRERLAGVTIGDPNVRFPPIPAISDCQIMAA